MQIRLSKVNLMRTNDSFLFQMNKHGENQGESTKANEFDAEELTPVASAEDVDDCIDQSIQINSNKQMRMEYLYPWTLKFKDSTQESKYSQLREDMFRSNMLCVFIVWVFIVLCQAVVVPKCSILIVCLVVSTFFLTAGCVLVMAEEFLKLPLFLRKCSASLVLNRNHRTLFICSVLFVMSVASSIGLFFCPMEFNEIRKTSILFSFQNAINRSNETGIESDLYTPKTMGIISIAQNSSAAQEFISNDLNYKIAEAEDKKNKSYDETVTFTYNTDINHYINEQNYSCCHPEYLVFTWILCLIALATGLKLYYLVKTFMATIMVVCYAVLISVIFPNVFESSSTETNTNSKYDMPLTARMNILLIVFLTMVTYHARLVEVTSRLDFIWKEQAEKELSNMKSNRILNDLLIKVCERSSILKFEPHNNSVA